MIGWAIGWLMGERRGRREAQREADEADEAFLEAQAERQRLRAPEPGPDNTVLLPPPSDLVGRRRHRASSLPWSFWIVAVILIVLAMTVNAWILLIGLVGYGAIKAFTADPR